MHFKQNSRSRILRVTALSAIVLAIGIHVATRSQSARNVALAGPEIPKGGVAENDTGGKVPGDPNNAVIDLQQFYRLAQIYRSRKGTYPGRDLFSDINRHPGAYGVGSLKDVEQYFLNPDDKFSDSAYERKNVGKISTYMWMNKRPDGTDVGAPKPQGKRDLLAYTSAYVHENIRTFSGQRTTVNPVGFYLVLWDDGQVQSIPYDQMLFVPLGKGEFAEAFPGQAGVPANALNYDEYYRLSGWKKGPRGEEGGKGQSYNGKPVR